MNKNKYLVYHRNSINGTFITILISPSLPSSPIHRAHWFISYPILSLLGFLYSLYLPSSIIFSGNDVSVLWLLESRPDVKGIFSLLLLLPFQQIHTVAIDVLFSNGERQIAAHSLPWGPFKSFPAVSFEERMAIHPWGHNLTLWIKGHILYCVGSGSPTAPYGVLSCLSKQANRKETLLNLVCSTYFEPKRSGIKYPYYLRKKSFEQRTVSIGKQRMAVDPWFCIVDSLESIFKILHHRHLSCLLEPGSLRVGFQTYVVLKSPPAAQFPLRTSAKCFRNFSWVFNIVRKIKPKKQDFHNLKFGPFIKIVLYSKGSSIPLHCLWKSLIAITLIKCHHNSACSRLYILRRSKIVIKACT